MSAYIVDRATGKIISGYKEASRANYVLTDCYAPEPGNTKSVIHWEKIKQFYDDNKNLIDQSFYSWLDVPLKSW